MAENHPVGLMRLLLIEDEEHQAVALVEALETKDPSINITVAANRDDAIAALDSAPWHLVVCDLRIPTTSGALDESVDNGVEVYDHVVATQPGTPVLILSAYAEKGFIARSLQERPRDDPFGIGGDRLLTHFFEKSDLPELIDEVVNLAGEVRRLEDIEVAKGGLKVDLSPLEERTLQIFGKRRGGTVVRVAPMVGGLSGSKTLRVEVRNEQRALVSRTVAKLGDVRAVKQERERYQSYVAPLMGAAAFPALAGAVESGAGGTGGLFLAVAEGFENSLFDFLFLNPNRGREIVATVREVLAPLRNHLTGRRRILRELREVHVSSDQLVEVLERHGLAVGEVEALEIDCSACVAHGDLHGANILLDRFGRPLLLDYARAGEETAALDPVTLEVSFLFHPQGREVAGGWPTAAQARHWDDLDEYLKGCPFPDFIRACRDWAFEEAAGDREVFSAVYCLATRQLTFGDADELAVALIQCALEHLL